MLQSQKNLILAIAAILAAVCGHSAFAAPIYSGAQLWLRADAGVLKPDTTATTTTGDAVATWETQIGSLDVGQAAADKQPSYQSGAMNGLPAILFDPSGGATDSDILSNTVSNIVSGTSPRTTLVAADAISTSEGGTLFTYRRSTRVNTNSLHNSGPFFVYSDGVSGTNNSTIANPGNATRDEIRSPFVSVHKSIPATTPTLTPIGVDLNGTLRPVSTGAGGGVSSDTGTDGFSVGGREDQAAGTFHWNGLIAEVLVYDRVLNTAETVISTNYLSAKYGTVLAGSDVYFGDDNAQSDYDFDVFGIGQDAATANGSPAGSVASANGGDGLILDEWNTSLDDSDYVLAGHKTTLNALTGADVPAGLERWERVWYVDQTGTVDTTLTFDFSEAGLTFDSNPLNEHFLLYSPTDPFAFTALALAAGISGDQVSFNVPSATLLDGYYTIAFVQVPEPSSAVLLGLGLFGIARRRPRKSEGK